MTSVLYDHSRMYNPEDDKLPATLRLFVYMINKGRLHRGPRMRKSEEKI